MKAAYINSTGPAENIIYGDLAEPALKANDVLVKVTAVAVNPVDTYIRSGTYKVDTKFPFIVGRDMVGVVERCGSGVTDFKPGERVWANNQGYGGRQGTFAELLSIDETFLYHLPNGCDPIQTVAILHSGLTAVVGLSCKSQLKSGETIFIDGGSGNVGNAVIQLAKARGARVAVTAGSEEKAEWCRTLGADLVINYKTEDIDTELRKLAPEGVDVYWHATKSPNVEKALSLMARRGRMVIMSGLSHRSELPIGPFYTRNCTIYGFTITDRTVDELRAAANEINDFLQQGKLKSKIFQTLPLAEAVSAHRLMEHDDLFGKIVLLP